MKNRLNYIAETYGGVEFWGYRHWWGGKMSSQTVLAKLCEIDPTEEKKYLVWLVNQARRHRIYRSDFPRLKRELRRHNELKKSGYFKRNTQYRDFGDIGRLSVDDFCYFMERMAPRSIISNRQKTNKRRNPCLEKTRIFYTTTKIPKLSKYSLSGPRAILAAIPNGARCRSSIIMISTIIVRVDGWSSYWIKRPTIDGKLMPSAIASYFTMNTIFACMPTHR